MHNQRIKMKFNFDRVINRQGTKSRKWDTMVDLFDSPDVLPMWIADMDFAAPAPVVEAIIRRAVHGVYGYPEVPESYFESIVEWCKRRHNMDIAREWINHAPGIVTGISLMIQAFTEPGDKIIIQPPVYHPFNRSINFNKRQPLFNQIVLENGKYFIDFNDLELKAKSGAKCIILCNPHNPVGRVWKHDELQKVVDICERHDIIMISDEIHSDLIYDGSVHTSLLHMVEGTSHKAVICIAPSKTFNLAGLKVSAVVIPNKDLRNKYDAALRSVHVVKSNIFAIEALEVAYRECDEWLNELLRYLKANLDFIVDYVEANIPRIKCIRPEGTFLLWLDCRELGLSNEELKRFMIERAKLGFSDGTSFGPGGEGFQRMNFGCPRPIVERAVRQLKEAVASLKS